MNSQLFLAVGLFVAFWFWLWSVIDVAAGTPGRFRLGDRRTWFPVVLFIPVVGGVVYLILGRFVPAPPRIVDKQTIGDSPELGPQDRDPIDVHEAVAPDENAPGLESDNDEADRRDAT